jgi:Flp pilus assembly secretin CpaC
MRVRTVLLAAVSLAYAALPAAAASVSKAPATAASVKKAPAAAATGHKAHARVHYKVHKVAAKHQVVHANANGVAVPLDEVRVVAFSRPVSTVFVGNPFIADATVIDNHHIFVLGKGFGSTNMIALGPQSETIANQQITVVDRAGSLVTLNKGASQYSYACTGEHCQANPVPGDQKAFFDDNTGATSAHQDQGVKAATAGR